MRKYQNWSVWIPSEDKDYFQVKIINDNFERRYTNRFVKWEPAFSENYIKI